ncbi:MAG: DNA polymerase III subunit delta' [Lachnospiraceae bacterium]|nr:DNA polymerase III subunit delta' [Lachnospiraceae bacterium]
MVGFKDIIGQESIIAHMKNAINMNKISHAYIINGESGMGKKTIAKIFSMTLQCERGGDEPCMECHSCKQALSNNHPDIKWVSHEKVSTISVDDIREQINNDIAIKPYSGKHKIYIVDEAEKMNVAAQNALLKTIEEPPVYGNILLLTSNKEGFLQTILSRCVSLDLKPLQNEQIIEYLTKEEKVPDYQAKIIANFAGGNLGRAIRLATIEEFNELKDMILRQLKGLESSTVSDISGYVKEVSQFKNNISEYIDLMVAWFRDVLIFKASKDINQLIFKDEISLMEKYSIKLSYNGINEIFESADKVNTRLRANVNFELTIELMLMCIRDNL